MADGISTLGTLKWGTSSSGTAVAADDTTTLGVDRLDARTPPDQYHLWGAQISAAKNLLISMSQSFKSGTRLGLSTQSATPFGASEQGFWCDTSGNPKFSYGGTNLTLIAPSLANKGDLISYTGAAVSVLSGSGVTNGWVLTYDSTQATGLKWAAGGGGGTGNWTFSTNNADLTGAATMGIGLTTATGISLGGTANTNGTIVQGNTFQLTQNALTSGGTSAFLCTGGAHTGLTASTEFVDFNINLNQTKQHATGAITTQRAALFQAPTYSFVGASTITNAATLAITGAPAAGTNATLTNSWALWLQAGNMAFAPAASIQNASQGGAGTVGLTVNPNVADGASSVALRVNSGTTFSNASAYLLQLQNNGTSSLNIKPYNNADNGAILQSGDGTASKLTLSTNQGTVLAYNSNAVVVGSTAVTIQNVNLVSDTATTLGQSTVFWPAAYLTRQVVKNQIIAAAASITVNPASGDYVRINLSATAITSLTVSAGLTDGEEMTVEVVEDATGTRTIPSTWTNVAFAGGSYTRTATPNSRDLLTFVYNAVLAKWVETGRAMNVT